MYKGYPDFQQIITSDDHNPGLQALSGCMNKGIGKDIHPDMLDDNA